MNLTHANDMSLSDAALFYAKAGYKIVPLYSIANGVCNCHKGKDCNSPGKHPRTMNGMKAATDDLAQVKKWWRMWPDSNIGVPTGSINGFIVADVDGYHGGDTNDFPATLIQQTGSGEGYHYLYKADGIPLKSKTNVRPGIDSRAEGGYIVVSPSLHISGNRYKWITDSPLSKPPKWWVNKTAKSQPDGDFIDSDIEPGSKEVIHAGGRNHYLTAEAGKRRRAGDSKIEIFYHIMGKNVAKCDPPLDEAEVKKIAHSVSRYETQDQKDREFIEIGSRSADLIKKTYQERVIEELKVFKKEYVQPPSNMIPQSGLIHDISQFILSQSRYPQPLLAAAASISYIGALMGQKYETETGLCSNVYMLGLAQSGAGKDAARKVINRIAHKTNTMPWIGGSEIASGSGLISSIAEHPAKLFMLDEFGLMMQSFTGYNADPHRKQIMQKFMELYSTAGGVYNGTDYADRKKSPNHTIVNPCCVLYGTSTHDSFYRALSSAEASNGAIARFMIIDVERKRGLPQRFKKESVPQHIISQITDFANYYHGSGNLQDVSIDGVQTKHPKVVPMKKEVEQAMYQLECNVVEKMSSDMEASIYSRVAENAAKLALIHAVSRNYADPIIDEQSFLWGKEIALWSANTLVNHMIEKMADNETERRNKQAIELIEKAGEKGMSKSELTQRTMFWKAYERNDFLESVGESGIIMQRTEGKTRPKTVYVHHRYFNQEGVF